MAYRKGDRIAYALLAVAMLLYVAWLFRKAVG
jgi:hypothetical protein